MTPISTYLEKIQREYASGSATEHSYRPALKELVESLLPGMLAINEPKRIECGAPDFSITKPMDGVTQGLPIGYIEAKNIGVNLNEKGLKEQFDRYLHGLQKLIITDYLEFRFYRSRELEISISLAELKNKSIVSKPENFEHFGLQLANFAAKQEQLIKSPARLAVMMAGKAKLIAYSIKTALDQDDKNGKKSDLKEQMHAFRDILIHDLGNAEFADIYAQTICYGMFAARYHDTSTESFSKTEAAELIPKSNPFLRTLFQQIVGFDVDERISWTVNDLVSIFLSSDIKEVMNSFGKRTRQEDPVVHFYETFLGEYDSKLKKARGVWYTPEPVVGFIVRATDEILKSKFDLSKGLSDTGKTTIQVDSGHTDRKGKMKKVGQEVHRLQILDPAAGTGTFLVNIVRYIYDTYFSTMPGMWPDYVKQHLIPRIIGFELLMTSYAMAHLKLDMLLTETGYNMQESGSDRFKIYLTNSLEEHHEATGTLFAAFLSREANEANFIKRDCPVMVVIGNPPYSISSSNKSHWIQTLIDDYKKDLNERNIQPLSDDYIKFIRLGQYYVDQNGEGILAYISNNSFIDGIIHRKMRQCLLESFDEIYILDLHGSGKKKETAPGGGKDENVFDIQQGVSINLFIKTGKKKKGELSAVNHHDLYGKRDVKYEVLNQGTLQNIPWKKLEPQAPEYFFVPKDLGVEKEYKKGFSVNELFQMYSSGVTTHRDHFVIDIDKKCLRERMRRFFDQSVADATVKTEMVLTDASDFNISAVRKNGKYTKENIKSIAYRPFDIRQVYYDSSLIGRAREKIMRHMIAGENIALLSIVQAQAANLDYFDCLFVTRELSDKNMFRRGGPNIFPLYLYSAEPSLISESERTPNLNLVIVQSIATRLNISFVVEKTELVDAFAPIDLLDYIYAVLHSPTYRKIYKEFLKTDFPRIPYPTSTTEFWRLVSLGGQLRQLHLLETEVKNVCKYPASGSNVVFKPRYQDGHVYVNDEQYFENVPLSVWNFFIGGYQPAQKWLKDRSARKLDHDDITHYQKIIFALLETERIMGEIDSTS